MKLVECFVFSQLILLCIDNKYNFAVLMMEIAACWKPWYFQAWQPTNIIYKNITIDTFYTFNLFNLTIYPPKKDDILYVLVIVMLVKNP